jgi:5-methylthioribose kinase
MSSDHPWELTADNALTFLRERGWVTGPASVCNLAGGVSNLVLRVEADQGRFVLKQSRPQLRTRAAWFSDVERIYREQEVMEALRPLLPPGVVPRVRHADRERYVFAMDHAPEEARPWKEMLLSGEVDGAVAETAGRVLGMIHQQTATRPGLVERFADRTVFEQLRTEPFYARVLERHPALADDIQPLIDALRTARVALCHGDYTPKNLLVHGGGLTLVDYETAHLGEPAMDLGLFFAHLLLKAVHRPHERELFFVLVATAWAGYASVVTFEALEALLFRGLGHLGACLLARVDGTSPVDYLPEAGRPQAVRRLARWLLEERPATWGDVLGRAEVELAGLR